MTPADLDAARRRLGWSRAELARQAGYSERHVRRMCSPTDPWPVPPRMAAWLRDLIRAADAVKPARPNPPTTTRKESANG